MPIRGRTAEMRGPEGGSSLTEGGFSLIELAIVLVILGTVITMGVQFAGSHLENQRRKETLMKLDTIEQALVLYAAQNRRLPCPADGILALNNNASGVEAPPGGGTCDDAQRNGVVPWVTLGLPTDMAIDGWGTMFLYRVADPNAVGGATQCGASSAAAPAPTESEGLRLSNCDPTIVSEMTDRLTGLGLPVGLAVNPGANEWLARPSESSGAAYVLISHGPNALGGLSSGGASLDATDASALEAQNFNDEDLRTNESNVYVDTHDDILRFATVAQLAIKAKLQPR